MSSKCVSKRNAAEKVGVLCRGPGAGGLRTMVIEYSDLPKKAAEQRDAAGELTFGAANIAVHALSVAFAQRLARGEGVRLPWHRAHKKVPCIDLATGKLLEPSAPNAYKFECFIFDALELAERSLTMQVNRVEEFAPIKNAEGEDSPASSHRIQSDRHGAWLEAAGAQGGYGGKAGSGGTSGTPGGAATGSAGGAGGNGGSGGTGGAYTPA